MANDSDAFARLKKAVDAYDRSMKNAFPRRTVTWVCPGYATDRIDTDRISPIVLQTLLEHYEREYQAAGEALRANNTPPAFRRYQKAKNQVAETRRLMRRGGPPGVTTRGTTIAGPPRPPQP